MNEETKRHSIHRCKLIAMDDIARQGIAKELTASLGGAKVKYRGIEAAMNKMSAVLIRAGITVSARYSDLQIVDRVRGKNDSGEDKYQRTVTLKGAFTFSADDGSFTTFEAYGEAMDSGDKAVTKAQSVAFRTALFQEFVVPTVAIDPEADGDDDMSQLEKNARSQAALGAKAYEHFFLRECTLEQRKELAGVHAELKEIAAKADAERASSEVK